MSTPCQFIREHPVFVSFSTFMVAYAGMKLILAVVR
jgi:hypothetical protein